MNDYWNTNEAVVLFNGFSFPKLSSLRYTFEGFDKKQPTQLFIEDRAGRFLVSIDVDMKDMELLIADKTDYDHFEFFYHNKCFSLSYPCQQEQTSLAMGYFRIDVKDLAGDIHSCIGQLSITPPKKYIVGLKEFDDLQELFKQLAWYERQLIVVDDCKREISIV